jgi:hypothetical protein
MMAPQPLLEGDQSTNQPVKASRCKTLPGDTKRFHWPKITA